MFCNYTPTQTGLKIIYHFNSKDAYNQNCENSIQNTRSNQCNSKRVDVGRVDPMLKVCYWNFVIEEICQYPWLQAISWLCQLGTMGTTVWHRFTPCHCVTVFPEKYTAKTVASFNTVILQDKKSKSHVPNGLTTSYDCEPLKHWIRICGKELVKMFKWAVKDIEHKQQVLWQTKHLATL